MEDFPAKIADLLETFAARARSMTVDRLQGWAKWTAVGVVLATLALLVVIFLFVGVFRLLGELIGVTVTYAVIGGLFVIAGMLLWSKRKPKIVEED
ncbi:MAG: hypothetical protein ACE5GC_04805 [Acidimicrobiia bacterium]